MKKQSARKQPKSLNIRLLFIMVTMVEILGTLAVASLLAGLLTWLVGTDIQVSPLLWLIIFSFAIGVAMSVTVNIYLLRPIVRLNRAMKQVAEGDFTQQLETHSRVTEIRDSYHSFNRMVQALNATETLQSDFVSNVSHEFKTPINAIEGYAMLLQGSASPEEQAGYVSRILLNTRRLSTLVGNILLLSKVDNHAIATGQSAYRLDEQIRQSVLLLEPKWTAKDIDLDVDLEEVDYQGQEAMMLHVWNNLIDNAIKFDPPGGLLRIRLTREDQRIVVTVADGGPGIPEDAQPFIFNKFYQSDSSHRQEGNGLGLALVKRILDQCGGSIGVRNLPEGGCCFTVTL